MILKINDYKLGQGHIFSGSNPWRNSIQIKINLIKMRLKIRFVGLFSILTVMELQN